MPGLTSSVRSVAAASALTLDEACSAWCTSRSVGIHRRQIVDVQYEFDLVEMSIQTFLHQSLSLSADVAKTLVQVFISSRLDYCDALLHGISDGLMRRLQSVQNAAARLITLSLIHI